VQKVSKIKKRLRRLFEASISALSVARYLFEKDDSRIRIEKQFSSRLIRSHGK